MTILVFPCNVMRHCGKYHPEDNHWPALYLFDLIVTIIIMSLEVYNSFYELSKKEKFKFQVKIVVLCGFFLVPIFFLSYLSEIYFIAPIVVWLTISIVASFFDVPSLIESGKLEYQSRLLFSEKKKNNLILIHGGTLFDYYFTFNKNATVNQRKKLILSEYLRGILAIIHTNRENLKIQIKGTTYILNEKTANKIGFKVEKTDFIQKTLLLLNYPALIVSKSFVNKKLSLPNLKQIKTYKSDIDTLKKNKETIEKINNRLLSTIDNGM